MPVLRTSSSLPARRRRKAFLEFFIATIRNPNTRLAYARAVAQFLNWSEEKSLTLERIQPLVVATYIEKLTQERSTPTVKQHLAAIRMLFDWLVIRQILPWNPSTSVRGPRYVVRRGKTPVLTADQARHLLDSIDVSKIAGLRDRAILGVMVYSFARVGAVCGMNVDDYYQNGKRYWLRLHEKGGSARSARHHNAEAYLDAYIAEAASLTRKRNLFSGRSTRSASSRRSGSPETTSSGW